MLTINSFVLYVEDIHVSQAFYSKLFDCEVTFLSPTFASMPLANGLKLTLKQSDVLSPFQRHQRWWHRVIICSAQPPYVRARLQQLEKHGR